jgi:hypothetical protein
MSAWKLPTSVTICGQQFAVRSDFRAVLDAIVALNDTSQTEQERFESFIRILYPRWRDLPDMAEAMQEALVFINLGKKIPEHQEARPKLVDWETDVDLIAPAIDKALGYSCRRCEYLHWWEFIGAYYNIGDGVFAQVVSIRNKRLKGKPLEKYEQEFFRDNPDLFGRKDNAFTAEEEAFLREWGCKL